jgi:hypothetical protein
MNTIAGRVEKWYGDHIERLKAEWPTIHIKSHESADPTTGKVTIQAGSTFVTAMVTFWNKGDVTVLRLDLPAQKESVVDDRVLSASEDVAALLDSYFRELALPAE